MAYDESLSTPWVSGSNPAGILVRMHPNVRRDLLRFGELDHGLTDRQGMLSFIPPPIPYGLFKKNSRLPSAASAY